MVSEFKVAIVGCGALGFRYLQAVLSSSVPSDIIVIDKSLESLAIAQKYISDQGVDFVRLSTSLSDLSTHLDLCIVATTASSRLSLVRQILDMSSIGYLILEKVIEQSTFNCSSFLNLIPSSTQSYVHFGQPIGNCPRFSIALWICIALLLSMFQAISGILPAMQFTSSISFIFLALLK